MERPIDYNRLSYLRVNLPKWKTVFFIGKHQIEFIVRTRTAWAVFKYCGTKTVPLRMKK
jgi:hypothetical protein